ncbi:unnamed protein product [Paramecium sonneborni]|uniref:Uncharacterized protein n=1 Tax=Paramecium sonneborni TaxID=65129 RepID=A0A8S1RJF7_9CILI|nr:unnamed protein product [Paramecium sonneborni]
MLQRRKYKKNNQFYTLISNQVLEKLDDQHQEKMMMLQFNHSVKFEVLDNKIMSYYQIKQMSIFKMLSKRHRRIIMNRYTYQ